MVRRRSSKVFVKGVKDGSRDPAYPWGSPHHGDPWDRSFPSPSPPAYPLTPVRFRHHSEKVKEAAAAGGGSLGYGTTPTKAHFSAGRAGRMAAGGRGAGAGGGDSLTGTPKGQHVALTVGGSTSSTPRRDGATVRDQFTPSRVDPSRVDPHRISASPPGGAECSSPRSSGSSGGSSWGVTRMPEDRHPSQQGSFSMMDWVRMLGHGSSESPPDTDAGRRDDQAASSREGGVSGDRPS